MTDFHRLKISVIFVVFSLILTCESSAICNLGTSFECDCTPILENVYRKAVPLSPTESARARRQSSQRNSCAALFRPGRMLRAASVIFAFCAARHNEESLKNRLADWIMEECTMAQKCPLSQPLTAENVILLTAVCRNDTESGFSIVVATNTTVDEDGYIDESSLLSPILLITILKTREALLSVEFGSHITGIRMTPFRTAPITVTRTSDGAVTMAAIDRAYATANYDKQNFGWENWDNSSVPWTPAPENEGTTFIHTPAFIAICVFGAYVAIVWVVACMRLQCVRDRFFSKKQYRAANLILDERPNYAIDTALMDTPDAEEALENQDTCIEESSTVIYMEQAPDTGPDGPGEDHEMVVLRRNGNNNSNGDVRLSQQQMIHEAIVRESEMRRSQLVDADTQTNNE